MGHFWNRSGTVKDFLALTQETKLRDGRTQLDPDSRETLFTIPQLGVETLQLMLCLPCLQWHNYSSQHVPQSQHSPLSWLELSFAAGGESGGAALPPCPAPPGCPRPPCVEQGWHQHLGARTGALALSGLRGTKLSLAFQNAQKLSLKKKSCNNVRARK